MTTSTTTVDEAAAVVSENETRTADIAHRFTRARDQLDQLSRESDSRVTSSSRYIATKATAEKLVEELALDLEEARIDLKDAREAHQAALEAACEAALPDIMDERHVLAGQADQLIIELNQTLAHIMALNGQEITARTSAGQDPAGVIRHDKILSGWVMVHLLALRSLRGPGSLTLYPMCRSDLATIYKPSEETGS